MNEANNLTMTVSGKQVVVNPNLKDFKLFKMESSLVDYFGTCHLNKDSGNLFIQFNGGNCTLFTSVPKEVLDIVEGTSSIGKTYHALIKGKYPFTEMGTYCVTPIHERLPSGSDDFDEDDIYDEDYLDEY